MIHTLERESELVMNMPVFDLDQLTGLPKRHKFAEELNNLNLNNGSTHALCQIDIDSFMVINDVYGHASGDALLVSLAALIKKHISEEDFLARIGDDEYGLVIKYCDVNYAVNVANRIREEVKKLRISDVYSATVSIGMTMLNQLNDEIEINLKNIDVACRSAKQSGDKIELYQGDDIFTVSYHNDTRWLDKIRSALNEDRFEVYAQAIVPLDESEQTNQSILFETLVRMLDTDGNLVYPNDFLPIAAKYNLSARIDLMVVKKVIDFLNENPSFAQQCSSVMINLSAQSLGDQKLIAYLNTHLHNAQFPPEILCFEVTETEAISNVYAAINFMNLVRTRFGCRFALDDFGSGFCSFKYIKELPADIIKLDGSFVSELNDEPISHVIVQSICDIAKLSNKKVIAEWVETKEILALVKTFGVDYAQGYFFGHPMLLSNFKDKY